MPVSNQKLIKPVRNPERRLLWFLAVFAMAATGAALYLRHTQMLEEEHGLASFLIRTASQQAATVCRDFAEIDLKRKNLEIARGLGETGFVDAYGKQIEWKEENIRDAVSGYNDTILKLVDLRKTIVDEEFNEYTKQMVRKGLFHKVRAIRLVKGTYLEFVNNKRNVTVETIRRLCNEQ